ncbi:hypothetical protein FC15_GL000925 [Lapidilactobacillus concavus DSM 17758]|uniref:AraC-type arabinose-binding/dimerisation domain-containing protein n=1 Tax=Lapidilactobacillus concavus DSM 17758 TaxID=1423735 RepID=A0A0R1W7A8_9LACO|nr:hypothetical protein FC15_GL000925 [Lapidilactobacillus concavus DSM 17758]GEL12639.1 hypothetical protein LCO01nite_01880 [Lapidilactobacillus concavus]
MQGLVADPEVTIGVGNVTFELGCRNNWHIHHDGYQILLVTGGEGWIRRPVNQHVIWSPAMLSSRMMV